MQRKNLATRALKKKTRDQARAARARTKLILACVAGMCDGYSGQMLETLELNSRHREQARRIQSWSDACFQDLQMGVNSARQAIDINENIGQAIHYIIPASGRDIRLEHYAAVWIMISFLLDEARDLLAPEDTPRRRKWNYLAGVVNTWTGYIMEAAQGSRVDYEELGGRLSESVWPILFDRPKTYFGKI